MAKGRTVIYDKNVVITGANVVVRRLDKMSRGLTVRDKIRINKQIAQPIVAALKAAAPVRKYPVIKKRYQSRTKAKRYGSRVLATYRRGNLKKSISVGTFRTHDFVGLDEKGLRTYKTVPLKGNLFIGAGGIKGQLFTQPDGYYMHFVHDGIAYKTKTRPNRFVERVFQAQGDTAAARGTVLYGKFLSQLVDKSK